MYLPLEPYDSGLLDVGEGQLVYWEVCGNPEGKPAVFLHGGPGTGCNANARRMFDPAVYRIVVFDQRGSGRSRPHASELGVDLASNTTAHLVGDLERLRQHLGIERWLIFGGSWGVTLALAYAERYPERVSEMVLASIALTTPWEIEWMTRGVGVFFPEAWARFCAGVPEGERGGNLVAAYHRRLMDPDPVIHTQAARDWCDWELAVVQLHPSQKAPAQFEDAAFRLGFARLVTHYWSHQAWLEDGELLRHAHRLAGIPGVLVHGRLDLGCPLTIPWQLAQAWPGSELVIVEQAGHGGRDPSMNDCVQAALDRFATRK